MVEVIGHHLQHNGETDLAWKATRSAAWRAFFAQGKANSALQGMKHKWQYRNFERTVLPLLRFKTKIYPFCAKGLRDVDQLQRKIVGSILRTQMQPAEPLSDFCQRKIALLQR